MWGELLYRQAARDTSLEQHLLDQAHQAFERECQTRGLSDEVLGHREDRVVADTLENRAAEREAREFGMTQLRTQVVMNTSPALRAYLDKTHSRHAGCVRELVRVAEGSDDAAGPSTPVTLAKAPRGQLRLGAAVTSKPIEEGAIERATEPLRPLWLRCYADGQARNAELTGRVALHLVVDRSGAPFIVKNGGSDLPDPAVTRCILVQAHQLRLPVESTTSLILPLILSPSAPVGE